MDALFCVEDGKGLVAVAESARGSIVGYAFALNLGSSRERDLATLDMCIHPNYLDHAARFAEDTAGLAARAGMGELHSFAASCDEAKVASLAGAGFQEQYRFRGGFRLGDHRHDILVMRRDAR
jgi:hypothetical protein